MRIHILQHLPHENAGSLLAWADKHQYTVTHTFLYDEDDFLLPPLPTFDMLVVLGGTMGVYEEEKYSWLAVEKLFIKHSIAAGKIVLGICLGSQLLAEVLGGKVYPHTTKEIGFFPITKTAAAEKIAFLQHLPTMWQVFHWHGDTFDLPPNAIHLFRSEACENQGFLFQKTMGLQFHAEMTQDLLKAMIEFEREELVPQAFIQTEEEITKYDVMSSNLVLFEQFLDAFLVYCSNA